MGWSQGLNAELKGKGIRVFWQADQSMAGKAFRGSLPSVVERFGSRLIERYNQEQGV
jgi:hypothetical protein